jgi:prefoldin subunit 5
LYNTYQEQIQHNQKVIDDINKAKSDFYLTEQDLKNKLT